jgi:hypothetical protein
MTTEPSDAAYRRAGNLCFQMLSRIAQDAAEAQAMTELAAA